MTRRRESQIFGQRLSASGAEVGSNDFQISHHGPAGTTSFKGNRPAVAHRATTSEYLVIWTGDDDSAPLVDNEIEVFGQRLVPTFLDFFVTDVWSDDAWIPIPRIADGDPVAPVAPAARAGRR